MVGQEAIVLNFKACFVGIGSLLIVAGFTVSEVACGASAIIEEVVVTAQKRNESLQDVPITMQVFTGDQLSKFGVSQVSDITRLAPNLNIVVQNAMSQHIVIRGVGTNEFFGNAASSVGSYMDEVTMNSSYMSTLGLFDIQRVEVLRGPQNSLFGRNTTGGAVNYISNLPTVGGSVSGYLNAIYGSYDRVETEGTLSFPVGDTVAVRAAFMTHDRDGRWNNITEPDSSYGDSNRYSFRGTLIWEAGENTTITASYHTAANRSDAQPQKAFGTLTDDGVLRLLPDEQTIAGTFTSDIDFDEAVPYVSSQGFNVSTTSWDDIRTGGSQRADLDVDGGYIKLVHNFDTVTLTTISAWDNTRGYYEEDNGVSGLSAGDNTEALTIDMDQEYKQFSQEIRLSSDAKESFRWIAGAYFFSQEAILAQNIRFGDNGVLAFHPIVNNVPASVFGFTDDVAGFFAALDAIANPFGNTASFSVAELEDDSFSLYGQAEYDISDSMTLTVGLRYTEDIIANPSYYAGAFDITGRPQETYYDKGLVLQLASALPACQPISATNPPFQQCANNNTDRKDIETDEVGGKIGVDYRFSEALLVYGSFSRGFKSGKFDVEFLHTDATPFPQRSLDVETLDVFELGFKAEMFDGAMQLNGAIFKNTWTDQQVFNVGSNGPEFFNLPESEIVGAELEMKWVPAETWLISLSLGILDSEITDATGIDFNLGQGEFQEGHELPLAPDLSANWAVFKDISIGGNTLTLQWDGRYQSASKVKFKPSAPIDEYNARLEMNVRANYLFGNAGQYEAALFLNNITEEEYCLEKQDLHALTGIYYCVPNEGDRQFGLQGRVSF